MLMGSGPGGPLVQKYLQMIMAGRRKEGGITVCVCLTLFLNTEASPTHHS